MVKNGLFKRRDSLPNIPISEVSEMPRSSPAAPPTSEKNSVLSYSICSTRQALNVVFYWNRKGCHLGYFRIQLMASKNEVQMMVTNQAYFCSVFKQIMIDVSMASRLTLVRPADETVHFRRRNQSLIYLDIYRTVSNRIMSHLARTTADICSATWTGHYNNKQMRVLYLEVFEIG